MFKAQIGSSVARPPPSQVASRPSRWIITSPPAVAVPQGTLATCFWHLVGLAGASGSFRTFSHTYSGERMTETSHESVERGGMGLGIWPLLAPQQQHASSGLEAKDCLVKLVVGASDGRMRCLGAYSLMVYLSPACQRRLAGTSTSRVPRLSIAIPAIEYIGDPQTYVCTALAISQYLYLCTWQNSQKGRLEQIYHPC